MSPFVTATLVGWPLVVIAVFAAMKPRHAVIFAYVAGWLLLPVATLKLIGLPDYGKLMATSLGAIFGVMLFDAQRLANYRFSVVDIPVLLWLVCPIPTSVLNGLGAYDGLSESLKLTLDWGVPVFIGRLYLTSPAAFRDLAIGLVIGGLAYVPLCLWEVRMSPNLHRYLYGFFQHRFDQAMRYGGYRPFVFMQHGLAVALYMGSCAFVAYWMFRLRSPKRVLRLSIGTVAAVTALTTVLCKTGNGLGVMLLGIVSFHLGAVMPKQLLLAILVATPPAYMAVSTAGLMPEKLLLGITSSVDAERARSLGERLGQERTFGAHAAKKPWFGWGGWTRNFPRAANGRIAKAIDSRWMLILSKHGRFGLLAWTAMMITGPIVFLMTIPERLWLRGDIAMVTALAFLVALYTIDSLLNDFGKPMFVLAIGGLSGLAVSREAFLAASPAGARMATRRQLATHRPALRPPTS